MKFPMGQFVVLLGAATDNESVDTLNEYVDTLIRLREASK